jgi:hypothetical protein
MYNVNGNKNTKEEFIMLKKCTGVMLSVILSVSSIMGVQASASNGGAAPTAMTPIAIGTSTTFPVGESDRATIKYWINDFKGGIDLYTGNYCDFYVKGYVEDSWGNTYSFSGTRYETTACGFSSGDYAAMQQIISVYANVEVCGIDGDGHFEGVARLY